MLPYRWGEYPIALSCTPSNPGFWAMNSASFLARVLIRFCFCSVVNMIRPIRASEVVYLLGCALGPVLGCGAMVLLG